MIKDNQKNFTRLHVAIDIVVIAFSYIFAWFFRFIGPLADSATTSKTFEEYMILLLMIIPGYLLPVSYTHLRKKQRESRRIRQNRAEPVSYTHLRCV